MKALMEKIEKITLLTITLILLISFGCSDDPSSPSEIEEEKPTTSATIGSEGGSIGTDDITITIPAGSFTSNQEIAIFEETDDGAFGEHTVSTSFKISGLPDDYSKTIKIKVKSTKVLTGDRFIAVGTEELDPLSGDSSIVYALYAASDSSGYFIGELPGDNESSHYKTSGLLSPTYFLEEIHIKLNQGYKQKNTENFGIVYPPSLEGHINAVEDIFESALKIVRNDLEINFAPQAIKGAILLKVQDEIVRPKYDPLLGTIFNVSIGAVLADILSNSELKISIGKHLIARELWYMSLPSNVKAAHWFNLATYTWVEKLFTNNPDFQFPQNYPDWGIAPFNGLRAGAGEYTTDNLPQITMHGIGMSSVIEYLTKDERYGKAGIGKTYTSISNNILIPAALLQNVDALIADWWPDFFKEYVGGQIYDRQISYFLKKNHAEWNIESIEDTLKVFRSSEANIGLYPDLSAKIFKINLEHNKFEETDNMLFSMDAPGGLPGLALVVFGVNKNGEAEYLGTAHAQDFEIPNLKSYSADMKQFIVVLVNCLVTSDDYLGTTNIDLKVEVKKQSELKLDYNRCLVGLKFTGNILIDYVVDIPDLYTTIVGMSPNTLIGSFSGNTFYGSYNEGGETGSLTVTLNEELNLVTEMSWSGNIEYSNSSTELGFSAVNIPISSNLDNMYIIKGNHTCNVITDAHYKNQSETKTSTLIDFSCDEYSYIEILFDKK